MPATLTTTITITLLAVSLMTAESVVAEPARQLAIRGLSTQPGYPESGVHVHDASGRPEGQEVAVKTFLNHERQQLEVQGSELVFTTGAAAPAGGDGAALLGRVKVPAGVKSSVFVFTPAEGGREAAVHAVDDSAAAFPAGSLKVLNLTGVSLRIELEGKTFDCPADKQTVIPDPPVNERNSSAMRAFRKEGEEWLRVASGMWPHPGNKRVLQVAIADAGGRIITLKGFRDVAKPD